MSKREFHKCKCYIQVYQKLYMLTQQKKKINPLYFRQVNSFQSSPCHKFIYLKFHNWKKSTKSVIFIKYRDKVKLECIAFKVAIKTWYIILIKVLKLDKLFRQLYLIDGSISGLSQIKYLNVEKPLTKGKK